jgi:hypothetical protein
MTATALFSLLEKEIIVTDLDSGEVLWSGRPLGRPVLELLQLPTASRAIALLDYLNAAPEERANLVAIDDRGTVLWRAKLPTTSNTDAFTDIDLVEGGVSAFTWSSHRVLIDIETGETLDDAFTK